MTPQWTRASICSLTRALSYGLVEYLRTLDVLREEGWSTRRVVPHGGHQMSLNIAAGLHLGGNESYPGVFHPFRGFCPNTRTRRPGQKSGRRKEARIG